MQPILDKAVRPSRVRLCRLSFPALALGLCALICLLQRAALGQAQVGAAETCFDEGPDKLPAMPITPIPSLRAEMPVRIAQLLQPVRVPHAGNQMAGPAHAVSQDSKARSGRSLKKKAPEGMLTAAR